MYMHTHVHTILLTFLSIHNHSSTRYSCTKKVFYSLTLCLYTHSVYIHCTCIYMYMYMYMYINEKTQTVATQPCRTTNKQNKSLSLFTCVNKPIVCIPYEKPLTPTQCTYSKDVQTHTASIVVTSL